MATGNNDSFSVTAQGDREVVMTRVFNAPRTLVFDAWTKPELLRRWFGPRGWTLPVCEIDLRPGGTFRYVMRGADGTEFTMQGVYKEVVRPERLVNTEFFEGFSEVGWRREDESLNTLVLTEQDGTTTWTATVLYPSKEVRDVVIESGMAGGLSESFERLDELLEPMAA